MASVSQKQLLLGTAQWGWTVPRAEAFRLLDRWLAAGHTHIDAATNYPINKQAADFRASEKLIREYLHAHGLHHLQITVKIGSLNNLRTPDINLEASFIRMITEEYRRLFGENLSTVMLHWDNRQEASAIRRSLEALAGVRQQWGIRLGLSGLRHPDIHAALAEELGLAFDIQLKHNVLQSDLERYAAFFDKGGPHRFFAYGINAGGAKLEGPYPAGSTFLARGGDPDKSAADLARISQRLPEWNTAFARPPVQTMNHLGLIYAGLHQRLDGLVLGFSSLAQLEASLDYWRNLELFDYQDVLTDIKKMAG